MEQKNNHVTGRFQHESLRLRKTWHWFFIFGTLITLCGAFALIYLNISTAAVGILLSTLFFVGGALQIVVAFHLSSIKRLFWGWLGSGALFLLAAIMIMAWPGATLLAITILIALALGVSGIIRTIVGYQARGFDGWVWLITTGIMSVLAALVVLFNLSSMALILPGLILAVDLLFEGIGMMMFGMTLRKALSAR